jgi:hypothetical protein
MLTCTASGCEGFLVFEKHTVAEVADRGLPLSPQALRYLGRTEIISDRATSCNSEALAHVSLIAVRQVGSENNENENIFRALALVILLV